MCAERAKVLPELAMPSSLSQAAKHTQPQTRLLCWDADQSCADADYAMVLLYLQNWLTNVVS